MSSRTDRHQQGLASLEFVLVLPILLVITFLAMAIVKIGHLRIDMQVSARNQAYQEVFGIRRAGFDLPQFLNPARDMDDETRWYVRGTVVTHPTVTANAGGDFYGASATGDKRFGILRQSVDAEGLKITPTARASMTPFKPVPVLGAWRINVREQYAVAAAPIWQRRQIPIGYDQYLYDELKEYTLIVPGIPGASLLQDIPFIDLVPGLEDIDDYDFDYLYHGVAADAVIDVFPKVNK